MRNTKITAIIPVYNGEKYISSTIESVLGQTYKNIEIIVVDDGSRDNSFEKITPYLSKIKYIFQENAGVCNARNKGILNSEGELIAFLDQDDIWLSEKVEKQVDYLLRNNRAGFVHTDIKYINAYGETIKPSGYWKNWKINGDVKNVKEIFMHYTMLPSTMMMKRQLFDEVGLWDQAFPYCQGYNLCIRIALKYPLGFINEPLVLYRLHDSNNSKNVIKFDLDVIKVIELFLQKYPHAHKIIGRKVVNSRCFELYSEMANSYFWVNNYIEARKYFWKAFKKHPTSIDCFKNFLWCSLTSSQRKVLRWYTYRIKKSLNI